MKCALCTMHKVETYTHTHIQTSHMRCQQVVIIACEMHLPSTRIYEHEIVFLFNSFRIVHTHTQRTFCRVYVCICVCTKRMFIKSLDEQQIEIQRNGWTAYFKHICYECDSLLMLFFLLLSFFLCLSVHPVSSVLDCESLESAANIFVHVTE